MGVVDNIKKAGGSVSKGAGKFTQVQLQQRKLRSLQGDVGRAEQEMGGLVFDLVERGDLVHPALDAPQAKIREASALVAEKEAEIAKLKAEPEGDEAGSARDAYVERLKTQLGGWSADIEMLKARAGKISADAKAEYEEQLAGLREQRDSLAAKVSDLQHASDRLGTGSSRASKPHWTVPRKASRRPCRASGETAAPEACSRPIPAMQRGAPAVRGSRASLRASPLGWCGRWRTQAAPPSRNA